MRLPLWLKIVWTRMAGGLGALYWEAIRPQNFLFSAISEMYDRRSFWMESPLIFSCKRAVCCCSKLYTPSILLSPS